jgi:hypothetical protein
MQSANTDQNQTPTALLKRALALLLNLPEDDPHVQAIAVAYKDCAEAMLFVVQPPGHGNVNIYFEDGWIKSKAPAKSVLASPDNRRRTYREEAG